MFIGFHSVLLARAATQARAGPAQGADAGRGRRRCQRFGRGEDSAINAQDRAEGQGDRRSAQAQRGYCAGDHRAALPEGGLGWRALQAEEGAGGARWSYRGSTSNDVLPTEPTEQGVELAASIEHRRECLSALGELRPAGAALGLQAPLLGIPRAAPERDQGEGEDRRLSCKGTYCAVVCGVAKNCYFLYFLPCSILYN